MANVDDQAFQPSTVTKPIQLLAAWLIGLIAVNTSFLSGAGLIRAPSWAPGLLVVAAILNVPLFLFCLFFLQTRFRPEMQEDSYYAKYLERKSIETQSIEIVKVEQKTDLESSNFRRRVKKSSSDTSFKVAVNDLLPSYEELLERLSKNRIPVSSTFGSTNPEKILPEKFIVTIGHEVDIQEMQRVIESIRGMSIDGFCLSRDWHANDVYLGAYNYMHKEFDIKPKSPTIDKLLAKSLTRDDLIKILT